MNYLIIKSKFHHTDCFKTRFTNQNTIRKYQRSRNAYECSSSSSSYINFHLHEAQSSPLKINVSQNYASNLIQPLYYDVKLMMWGDSVPKCSLHKCYVQVVTSSDAVAGIPDECKTECMACIWQQPHLLLVELYCHWNGTTDLHEQYQILAYINDKTGDNFIRNIFILKTHTN